jgi:Ner family transcriptional regulator
LLAFSQPAEGVTVKSKDWHPADIIAALRKKGTTLSAVSRAAGLCSSTLSNALSRPWPKGELLISQAVGVPACVIWPSRYYDPKTMTFIDRPMRSKKKVILCDE